MVGYINHNPQWSTCPGVVGQYWINSMLFCNFLLFFACFFWFLLLHFCDFFLKKETFLALSQKSKQKAFERESREYNESVWRRGGVGGCWINHKYILHEQDCLKQTNKAFN